jgi:hypothetical protein
MSGNTNFGRRRPSERKSVLSTSESSAGTSELIEAARSGGGSSPLGVPLVRQLGGILLGALVGVGNVGYPGVEDAYQRTVRPDASLEAIHNDCKSRSDFVRLDQGQAQAFEGFYGLYSGEAALAKAAYYVSCLTVEKPARMCHAAHRAHLIAALKDYNRLMGRVREERMMSTSGPFAAVRMTLMAPSSRDRGATTPPSARSDERVVYGLRMLIVDGYLSHRDLEPVLGPPGELGPALRGVEPKRAGCA